MKLKLKRPLVFYDLETTGLNVAKDKIVSIAITKIMPDNSVEKKYTLINPEMPIPKESSDIHGITDEAVKDSPVFGRLAKGIYEFMNNCDLAGYNINGYDNALLQEEFFRCGIEYPTKDTKSVDSCFIFKHFHKRDLSSALKLYCGEEMIGAHNADADTDATVKIFLAQLEQHTELDGKSIDEIHDLCNPNNRVDWGGKIVRDADGDYLYNFGMHKGEKVIKYPYYANWVNGKDFPETLKILLKNIIEHKL